MPMVEELEEFKTPEVKESFIGDQLVKFNVTDAVISDMKNNFMPLIVKGVEDKEGFEKVKKARLIVKGKRVEVEKKRKELVEDSVKYQRAVNTEAKRITGLLEPIELHLEAQEDIVKKEQERIEKEMEEQAQKRIQAMVDEFMKYGEPVSHQSCQYMAPEVFKERIEQAQKRYNDAVIKKAEEARLQAEEAARLEKIRLVQAQEAERLETALYAQREEKARIEAERKAIEEEKRKIEEAKQKVIEDERRKVELEKAKQEAAERAVKEAEEKAIREKEEAERKEQARIAEEARLEALKPDKEKLLAFAHSLELIASPELKDQKAIEIINDAQKSIRAITNKIRRSIETL